MRGVNGRKFRCDSFYDLLGSHWVEPDMRIPFPMFVVMFMVMVVIIIPFFLMVIIAMLLLMMFFFLVTLLFVGHTFNDLRGNQHSYAVFLQFLVQTLCPRVLSGAVEKQKIGVIHLCNLLRGGLIRMRISTLCGNLLHINKITTDSLCKMRERIETRCNNDFSFCVRFSIIIGRRRRWRTTCKKNGDGTEAQNSFHVRVGNKHK